MIFFIHVLATVGLLAGLAASAQASTTQLGFSCLFNGHRRN